MPSGALSAATKPIEAAHLEAPALVVITITTWRKSALRAVIVGQRAVVHHLQKQIEDVGVRLLDLVEQQHAMGAW